MELLFKKYFWTVRLAFIACTAFFVARTANAFVESAILPMPSGKSVAIAAEVRTDEPLAPLEAERVAKLTGLPLPPPPVDTSTEVDMNAAPVKTSLRVKLLGTLLAGLPEYSIASLQDLGNQKTQTYMVGDAFQGAEVLEIERSRVIIRNGGKREYISGDADGAPEIAASVAVKAPPSSGSSPSGIKATGENEYEVPRGEIDRTLSNLNEVAMQARIVPAFKDGVAQGFKVFSIRPDSIYSKIGVQNGDVIRRINGFEMNSPEKALEVYSKLKDSNRIDIELERNGAGVKKTYNVR